MKRAKDEKPRIANREAGIAKVINDFSNPLIRSLVLYPLSYGRLHKKL